MQAPGDGPLLKNCSNDPLLPLKQTQDLKSPSCQNAQRQNVALEEKRYTTRVEIIITIRVENGTNIRATVFVYLNANCCTNCNYNFNP